MNNYKKCKNPQCLTEVSLNSPDFCPEHNGDISPTPESLERVLKEDEDIFGYKINEAKLARDREIIREFRKEFSDNEIWWQECLAEMRIGDPDFGRLEGWILKKIDEIYNELGDNTDFNLGIQEGLKQAMSKIPKKVHDRTNICDYGKEVEFFRWGYNQAVQEMIDLLSIDFTLTTSPNH